MFKIVSQKQYFNDISTCTLMDWRRRNGNFLIKTDHSFIDVENHPGKAYDILFKLNFVFNIENPMQLENFYDFISGCIHKVTKPRACSDSLNTYLSIPVDINQIVSFE